MAEKKEMKDNNSFSMCPHLIALGFDKIIELIERYFNIEDSKEYFLRHYPKFRENEVLEVQSRVKEFHQRMQIHNTPPTTKISSILGLLKKTEKRVLHLEELSAISIFLFGVKNHSQWLQTSAVAVESKKNNAVHLTIDYDITTQKIHKEISRYFDNEGVLIRSQIPALKNIENKKTQTQQRRQEIAKQFIHNHADICSNKHPSIREGRLVIPVQVSYKSQVEGIIHGASASAQTVYIEIKHLYEENNKLDLLRLEEEKIFYEIAKKLSENLSQYTTKLAQDYAQLIQLDIVYAQYRLSRYIVGDKEYSFPTSTQDSLENKEYAIYLKQAVHPLIEDCTPLDIFAKKTESQLIVTGPNAGGKTVVLKTLGLIALMTQSGIMACVNEGAKLPVFRNIRMVIGDSQNLEAGESTFSSHLREIHNSLPQKADNSPSNHENDCTLLLYDELCSGTDEQEGGALAWAVLDFLSSCANNFTFVTTHSTLLKHYTIHSPHAQIAAMEYSSTCPYKIIYGSAGSSEVDNIARKIGLRVDIIARQQELLKQFGANTKELLEILHRLIVEQEEIKTKDMALLEENEARARAIKVKEDILKSKELELKKTRNLEASQQIQNIKNILMKVEEKERTLDELTAEIMQSKVAPETLNKKTTKSSEKSIQKDSNAYRVTESSQQLKLETFKAENEFIAESIAIDEAEQQEARRLEKLEVGDEVELLKTSAKGTVLKTLPDHKYLIQAGLISVTLSRSEIKKLPEQNEATATSKRKENRGVHVIVAQSTAEGIPSPKKHSFQNIDVRGENAEDALKLVEEQLNDASLAHLYCISILHGKGYGILRKAIHSMLREHPLVETFAPAAHEDGGEGKTIVYLQ